MRVARYMAVPVVTALGFPVLFVAIVMTGIIAVDRRIGKAIGPDCWNAVGAFDPPAQPAYVGQAGLALGFAGEADQFELDRREPVGLDRPGWVSQRRGGDVGVEMLIDELVVDGEMRDVVPLLIGRECAGRSRSLGGVMYDSEWSCGVVAGTPG